MKQQQYRFVQILTTYKWQIFQTFQNYENQFAGDHAIVTNMN